MRTCKVEGCYRKHNARGYCGMHYMRIKKHGITDAPVRQLKCKIDGCNGQFYAKKYCKYHYLRSEHVRRLAKKNVLKSNFGISVSEYDRMFSQQKGLCAICCQPEIIKDIRGRVRKLAVDHCHSSNKVRGLLCNGCNTGLGKFKDNPMLLKKAANYIENFKQQSLTC